MNITGFFSSISDLFKGSLTYWTKGYGGDCLIKYNKTTDSCILVEPEEVLELEPEEEAMEVLDFVDLDEVSTEELRQALFEREQQIQIENPYISELPESYQADGIRFQRCGVMYSVYTKVQSKNEMVAHWIIESNYLAWNPLHKKKLNKEQIQKAKSMAMVLVAHREDERNKYKARLKNYLFSMKEKGQLVYEIVASSATDKEEKLTIGRYWGKDDKVEIFNQTIYDHNTKVIERLIRPRRKFIRTRYADQLDVSIDREGDKYIMYAKVWGYLGKGYPVADYYKKYSPDTLNKKVYFDELPIEQRSKLVVMAMKLNAA
jgi:hypothetical protein